jgi:hypothetical protein
MTEILRPGVDLAAGPSLPSPPSYEPATCLAVATLPETAPLWVGCGAGRWVARTGAEWGPPDTDRTHSPDHWRCSEAMVVVKSGRNDRPVIPRRCRSFRAVHL